LRPPGLHLREEALECEHGSYDRYDGYDRYDRYVRHEADDGRRGDGRDFFEDLRDLSYLGDLRDLSDFDNFRNLDGSRFRDDWEIKTKFGLQVRVYLLCGKLELGIQLDDGIEGLWRDQREYFSGSLCGLNGFGLCSDGLERFRGDRRCRFRSHSLERLNGGHRFEWLDSNRLNALGICGLCGRRGRGGNEFFRRHRFERFDGRGL
jgi:hypothetical protein